MADGGETPRHNGNSVSDLRTKTIDEPSEKQKSESVNALEHGVRKTELFIRPA
jgi:hypothetical protein